MVSSGKWNDGSKVGRADRVRVGIAAVKRLRGADHAPNVGAIATHTIVETIHNGGGGRVRPVRVWNGRAHNVGARLAAPDCRDPSRSTRVSRAAIFHNGARNATEWRMHGR